MTPLLSILLLGSALAVAPDVARQTPSVMVQPNGSGHLKLIGTDRLPTAKGELIIGTTGQGNGRLELHGMRPASLFGGDFNTYVLWLVAPDGTACNAGEIDLNGRRGELEVQTNLEHFGVLITAEPYYLVDAPSRFVVLELAEKKLAPIAYRGFEGAYAYERDSLAETRPATGIVETAVAQAFTAVRLAQRIERRSCVRGAVSDAQNSLKSTLSLIQANADRQQIETQARETIRIAAAAQKLARTCISEDERNR